MSATTVTIDVTDAEVKLDVTDLEDAGWIRRRDAGEHCLHGEEADELRDQLRIALESTTSVADVVERWHYDQPTDAHPGSFKLCPAGPCKAVTDAMEALA